MSHYAKNRVEGLDEKKIDWKLVGKSIDLLEKNKVVGFKRVTNLKDYYGKEHKAKGIGLQVTGDSYALDLYMSEKTLIVGGESMGSSLKTNSHFMKEFRKAYTILATKDALQREEGMSSVITSKLFGSGRTQKAEWTLDATGF